MEEKKCLEENFDYTQLDRDMELSWSWRLAESRGGTVEAHIDGMNDTGNDSKTSEEEIDAKVNVTTTMNQNGQGLK